MEFDIDVSGEDLLSKNYTICIADKNDLIRGFKFTEKMIRVLNARHGEGRYRYGNSKLEKTYFKIRLYCVVVYYLFSDITEEIRDKELILNICKDFQGHEKDITSNLLYLLRDKLGFKVLIRHAKLPTGSSADKYAFLMRFDRKNLMKCYVDISLEDIEKFLAKKE